MGFSGVPVDRNAFFQILRKGFNIIPLLPFATVILHSRFKRKKQKVFSALMMLKCQGRSHVSDCMEEKLLLCLHADFASLFVKRCPWRSDGFVFTVLPEAGSRFFYGFLSIVFSSVCVKRRL